MLAKFIAHVVHMFSHPKFKINQLTQKAENTRESDSKMKMKTRQTRCKTKPRTSGRHVV